MFNSLGQIKSPASDMAVFALTYLSISFDVDYLEHQHIHCFDKYVTPLTKFL